MCASFYFWKTFVSQNMHHVITKNENDYQLDFFGEQLVVRKMLLSQKLIVTLHKKWSFPLTISSLNDARSRRNCEFRSATFLKRLQHRCFLVKFAKCLRTTILKNIWERLLLTLNENIFPLFFVFYFAFWKKRKHRKYEKRMNMLNFY